MEDIHLQFNNVGGNHRGGGGGFSNAPNARGIYSWLEEVEVNNPLFTFNYTVIELLTSLV